MELYFKKDKLEEFLKSPDAARIKEYVDYYGIYDDLFDAVFTVDKITGKIFETGFDGYTMDLIDKGYIEVRLY